jgi:hypothetical protein
MKGVEGSLLPSLGRGSMRNSKGFPFSQDIMVVKALLVILAGYGGHRRPA